MTTSPLSINDVIDQINQSLTNRSAVPGDSINALALSISLSDVTLPESDPVLARFFAVFDSTLVSSLDENDWKTVDPTNSLSDLLFKVCSLLSMSRILEFFPQSQWIRILRSAPSGSPLHRLIVSILFRHNGDPLVKNLIEESGCRFNMIKDYLSNPSPTVVYLQQIIMGQILDSYLTSPQLLDLYENLWNGDFLADRHTATLLARLLDFALNLIKFCFQRASSQLFPSIFLSPPNLKHVWADDPLLAIAFIQYYQGTIELTETLESASTDPIVIGLEPQWQSVIDVYSRRDADDFVLSSIVDLLLALSNNKRVRPVALRLFTNSRVLDRQENTLTALTDEEIKLYSTADPDFLLEVNPNCSIIDGSLKLNLLDGRYLLILYNFLASEKAVEILAPQYLQGNHLCEISRDIAMNILSRLVPSQFGRQYMYLRIPAAMSTLVVSCDSDLTNPAIWNQKLQILQALKDGSYPIPQLWEKKVDVAYKYMILGGKSGGSVEVKSVAL